MDNKALKELERISQAVGNSPDLVQGGGGNTSVKLDNRRMAVKASGYQLKQITPGEGFVVVDYKKINNYYENLDLASGADFEKEGIEFVMNNIVETEGIKKTRPSVEAGFHSILKKYVIHTHSVYANILCCSKEGRALTGQIFAGKPYVCLWIPYTNPGFGLTLKIKNEISRSMKNDDRFPEVIFMENHGLIINTDDCDSCIALDKEINRLIREHLKIRASYPEIILEAAGENVYISKTPYLNGFFKDNSVHSDYFDENILYPDQLVYLNTSLSMSGEPNKLHVNPETSERVYNAGYGEAAAIEETLLGVAYVIENVKKSGLALQTMPEKGIDFIRNWESEKYRKTLAGK